MTDPRRQPGARSGAKRGRGRRVRGRRGPAAPRTLRGRLVGAALVCAALFAAMASSGIGAPTPSPRQPDGQAVTVQAEEESPGQHDAPQLAEARSAIVTDENGVVLFSLNPDEEIPMASITKVMTAMVALDSGMDLDAPCTIHETNLGADSQTAGFTPYDTPTLRELIEAMLVYSANDAAENVAINVAGSEEAFVGRMNEKAAELGMTHTHFANPHGLDADSHYSSASDLATMGRRALADYPLIARTVCLGSVTVTIGGTPTTLHSTDELISSYEGMRGIKTGATASGTAFLGACRRDGITLYTAVLGCQTTAGRFADTRALLDWAWGRMVPHRVASAAWVVDVEPYALNFWWKVAVSARADEDALAWPEGGALSWRRVESCPGALLEPGEPWGNVVWSQDGRDVGEVALAGRTSLVRVPAVGPFELPLYAGVQGMGQTREES